VPKADEPSAEELQEIGRKLCALVELTPQEPVCAAQLRAALSHARCVENSAVRFALSLCADALAAHELPPEIHQLRDVLDEYARSVSTQQRLVRAILAAQPLLNAEADLRAEACEGALSEEQLANDLEAYVWPSPSSLRTFPATLLEVLKAQAYVVPWLQKVLDDLPRLEASHLVETTHIPVKTGITKALANAGYSPARIATITHPFAKAGRQRSQACNTTLRRTESQYEELLRVPTVPESAANADAMKAEIDRAARFVAGVGEYVCVSSYNPLDLERDQREPAEHHSPSSNTS
jgi:hypothetical protein